MKRYLFVGLLLVTGLSGYALGGLGKSDAGKFYDVMALHGGTITVTADRENLYMTMHSTYPRGAGAVIPWERVNRHSVEYYLTGMVNYVHDGGRDTRRTR